MQALSINKNSSFLHSFDVRSKISVSIVCAIVALFISSPQALTILWSLSFSYVLILNRPKVLLGSYLFMAVMMAISLICVHFLGILYPNLAQDGLSLDKALIPFLRGAAAMNAILPLALTLNMHKFLSTLQSLHLPLIIYLPSAVMIRFIPSFISDIKQIHEALKLKGFQLSPKNIFKNPRLFIRLTFIPLIFLTLRTADDLALAAELKGVGLNNYTVYKKHTLKKRDYVLIFIALSTAFLVLYIEKISGGTFIGGIHG